MFKSICRTLKPQNSCLRGVYCTSQVSKRYFSNNDEEVPIMDYRMLGNTGLKVSALSFGFWATYGVKEGLETCVKVMRKARSGGVNFFDNAEVYGNNRGDAEIIMGNAIKELQKEDSELWRRSDIVVSTKIFWGGQGVNEKGLSRKHIREGTQACLDRLQLDYVDVLFCHRYDPLTPTEEIVRAMTDEINRGNAFYWGTSEWSAQEITEAYWIAEKYNLIPPVVEQPQYNMMHRDRFESEYRRLYQAPYNMGTTIWSPLKSGVLTGKYNHSIPEGSRLCQPGYEWLQRNFENQKNQILPTLQALEKYAKEQLDCSMGCLALAWCLMNRNVSTVILGATKEHQIEENLKAIEVARRMTSQNMVDIEEILQNKPDDVSYWGRQMNNLINTYN